MESIDDLTVPWTMHGTRLARTVLVYADVLDGFGGPVREMIASELRDIIRCELNPLDDQLPQLGVPPTLRPPVPRVEPGEP